MLPLGLLIALVGTGGLARSHRHFAISYENNTFVKDGMPFRYLSAYYRYCTYEHTQEMDSCM